MTREEQYQEAAANLDKWKDSNYSYSDNGSFFILGAQWADANPNWILCSERLPDVDRQLRHSKPIIITNGRISTYGALRCRNWDVNNDTLYWECDNYEISFDKIIAWMEFPKYNLE